MSSDLLVWQSLSLPSETGRIAAERFVREMFTVDRKIKWGAEGEFTFADSYWWYRLVFSGRFWNVYRLAKPSPKAKARKKAKAEAQLNRQGES